MDYKFFMPLVFFIGMYVIFAYRNKFNHPRKTRQRALAAVISGWIFLILCKVAISYIETKREGKTGVYPFDGSKDFGIFFLGWLIPACSVLCFWMLHKLMQFFRK